MIFVFIISIVPYLVLMLTLSAFLARIRPYRQESRGGKTFLSVIVPCRNEAGNLPSLLQDLSLQDYPSEYYEVIVVDDHSIDATSSAASTFSGIENLKILTNGGSGKKEAIKTGILESKGDLIITTDADCRAGERWLSTLAGCYSDSKPDMIISPVSPKGGNGFISGLGAIEFLALQGFTAATVSAGNPVMCNGANLAFTRKAFLENEAKLHYGIESGDDMFLLHAMKGKKKYRIIWLESEDAVIETVTPGTMQALVSQRARWLSKAVYYRDPFTIISGIVTFVTISGLLVLLGASLFDIRNLILFAVATAVKSIPDLIITGITAARRHMSGPFKWYIPALLVYPFYVAGVSAYSLAGKRKWK